MARYAIDILIPSNEQSLGGIKSSHKRDNFDYENPLGVSRQLYNFVAIYLPWLVVITTAQNIFGVWVLKSSFLRGLVLQPMIRVYLQLHCLLMVTGPFYVWLGHSFGVFFTHDQVFPCFLLVWAHNFSMISTSCLLVAMIIERAISIGRPEVVWDIWRRACRNITYLLWATTLVFSVSGLLCVDLGTLASEDVDTYPVCMPWWDNELGSDVAWYKIVAMSFSTLPNIAALFSILLLTIRERRFKSSLRSGVSALNHFNAMYVEIKATLHFKFVRSFMWLGFLFVLTTSPIGLFIVLGPDLQITFDHLYPEIDESNSTSFQQLTSKGRPVFVGVPSTPGLRAPLRYSSISRTDVETCLWIVYYTFSLCVIPVFLKTEVLFWREWCGRVRTVTNFICCRETLLPKWRTLSGLNEETKQGHLVGPYIPSSNDLEVPFGIQKALDEARLTRLQETAAAATAGGGNCATETCPSQPNHQRHLSSADVGLGGESSRTNPSLALKKAKECGEKTRPARKKPAQKSEDTSSM